MPRMCRQSALLIMLRIPFDRALDFANKEKITELLYPLFVHNIGALLYHPTNQPRNHVAMATAERRKQEQARLRGGPGLPDPVQPHHHHSMHGAAGQHPGSSHSGIGRPDIPRSHTFPTPPTSATGVMGSMGSSDGFSWGNQNMNSVQSNTLAIDTGLSNARSMPTTPATTPPGASIHGVQQYQGSQSYDSSRQVYSAQPMQPGSYQQPNGTHTPTPSIGGRYSHPGNSYIKSEMGPPAGRVQIAASEGDHDGKTSNGLAHQGHEQVSQPHGDEEAEHENDTDYNQDNNGYDANRGTYNYAAPPVTSLGDHGQISPELTDSPNHQAGSGRVTPRSATTSQYYSQHTAGYNTPPRALPPSSNLYSVMSSERGTANGGTSNEMYSHSQDLGGPLTNGYSGQQSAINGVSSSNKRSRDGDDDEENQRPPTREAGTEIEGLKRRRTIHEDSAPNLNFDTSLAGRARAATLQRRRI